MLERACAVNMASRNMRVPVLLIISFLVVFVTDEAVRLVTKAEKKPPNMRTEQEKIALLGRPRLGDVIRAQIRIKESKEFKV